MILIASDKKRRLRTAPHCVTCGKRCATHKVESLWFCNRHSPLSSMREGSSPIPGQGTSNQTGTMKNTKIAELEDRA